MAVVQGVMVALPPPKGYVVDFEHPQRQGVPDAYWVAGVGMFLSLVFMAQRIYTKVFLSGGLRVDDALLVLSWMVSIATIGLCLHMFATPAGGVHAWEIPIENFKIYLVDVYIAASIYILAGSFAKLSLLTFYLRLSPERWFRLANWVTIFIIVGYTIGIFLSLIFACNPIAKSWDPSITEGTCINSASLFIATAVANIATDIILFVLPIPMVIKLQIPLLQKIGLAFIFTIGSLTIVTSVIRVTILPDLLTNPDQTWVIAYASVWIIVEANLLIICASIPTLRKFFRHVAPRVIGESTYGKDSKKHSAPSAPSALRTFGGSGGGSGVRRPHGEYSQFDDDLEADADSQEGYVLGGVRGADCRSGGDGGDNKRDRGHVMGGTEWRDDDSAEAIVQHKTGNIMQTRTVTVESEPAPRAKY